MLFLWSMLYRTRTANGSECQWQCNPIATRNCLAILRPRTATNYEYPADLKEDEFTWIDILRTRIETVTIQNVLPSKRPTFSEVFKNYFCRPNSYTLWSSHRSKRNRETFLNVFKRFGWKRFFRLFPYMGGVGNIAQQSDRIPDPGDQNDPNCIGSCGRFGL